MQRGASAISIMQNSFLFSFFIIFYSSRLFISIKQDGVLALVTDVFDFLEHSRACGEASPRSIGERKIGGDVVHYTHIFGTMDKNVPPPSIVVSGV